MTSLHEPRRAAAVLLVLLGTACSESTTAPAPGEIRVVVATLGADIDIDGYEFVVDSGGPGKRRSVFPNGTGQLADISAGTHTVKLELVAENCTVSGQHPRTVTVMPGEITQISFEVVCVGTGISITARTTGSYLPNSYDVTVDGRPATQVGSNGTVVVSRLQPGTHTVTLSMADHCTVAGSREKTIEVVARAVAEVLFDVVCVEPQRPERIAFVADTIIGLRSERWIGVVNPDGTGARMLAPGHSPRWSPDGRQLIFSTTYCDEWYYYYYADPCTGGVFLIDPETRNVTEVRAANAGLSPTWLPTGDRIAFRRCCERSFHSTSLHLVALSAGTLEVLTPNVLGISDPAWSPNGERIASSCITAPWNWDLCLMEKTGGNVVQLTNDGAYDYSPAWSPDGTRIAFSKDDGGASQIIILTVATGEMRTLTFGRRPSWSRDGKALVLDDLFGIHTIAADGTNRTRLTTGGHNAPAWRP